jgi:hypothetical protein
VPQRQEQALPLPVPRLQEQALQPLGQSLPLPAQVLPQLEPRQQEQAHRRQAQLRPPVPLREPLPEVPRPVVPQPVVRQPTVPQPAVPRPAVRQRAVRQPVVRRRVDGEDGELESARRARPTLPRKL